MPHDPHDRHLHDDRSPSHRRASFNDPFPEGADEGESEGRPERAEARDAGSDARVIPVDPQGGFGAESPAPFKRNADTGEEMTE